METNKNFVVKMSITPYLIPDMLMRREGDKTIIDCLFDAKREVFEDQAEAEAFWKSHKQIGNTDLWCD